MSDTPVRDSQPIGLTPERPWPGLASYAQSDKNFFFGREAESVELHRLVRAEPLAVLFGISGLGKTSLLEAGLFPRLLDTGWLPIPVRLDFAHSAPPLETQLLKAAEGAAGAKGLVIPQWHKGDTLWQAFHRRGQLFWGEVADPATPVLVLDQFEECFSLGEADPAMRQRTNNFLAQLSDLVNNRPPWYDGAEPADAGAFTIESVPLRVLLGLREDYLAALESLRTHFPGLRRAHLRLLPFTAAQARQVVERPGAGILGPGAADAILDTFLPTGAGPTEPVADPALLSLFCWQLNEQRIAARRDRLEAERIAGSREHILGEFYTGAFAGVENAVAIQRWVEESLVDAGGYRSSRSWDDALAAPSVTRPALDLLIKRRLLHPVYRPGAPTHLELTHDRLREVVVEKREARRTAEANAAVEARAAAAATELRRRLWRARAAVAVMAVLFPLAAILGYIAIADDGFELPGGDSVRRLLDHFNISLFRRIYNKAEVQRAAALARRSLIDKLHQEDWLIRRIQPNPRGTAGPKFDTWGSSQAICAVLRASASLNDGWRSDFLTRLDASFSQEELIESNGKRFGWSAKNADCPQAEPALWTLAAVAVALGRSDLLDKDESQHFLSRLRYTEQVANLYRPIDDGGWNIFPQQEDPAAHSTYTTALALLGLLEMRQAGLDWEGDRSQLDYLLRRATDWLSGQFDDQGDLPGWQADVSDVGRILDGLTLQIYNELLRCEEVSGTAVSPAILKAIPLHINRLLGRPAHFPLASTSLTRKFTNFDGALVTRSQTIIFPWLPWAIECTARWLRRLERTGGAPEERVQAERVLGYLVVNLGTQASRATSTFTFQASELLYALATIQILDEPGGLVQGEMEN